jgi:DNA phosphorothioation-associated putative methyltransferase
MSNLGKRIVDDLYVHLSARSLLADQWQTDQISRAIERLVDLSGAIPNVAKLNLKSRRLSLLAYPRFEEDPFPELAASWVFAAEGDESPVFRSYENSINRPILHRKELLVAPDHAKREVWAALTATAEQLGLFDDTATIGFRLNWERLIHSKGYQLVDGGFVPLGNADTTVTPDSFEMSEIDIRRHLTALTRSSLSAPIQLLIRNRLLTKETSLFDYGCGRGDDISSLNSEGFSASGWDPYFAIANERSPADIVNLGFVVNVIEDPAERVETVHKAFGLAKGVLAVSVMLHGNSSPGTAFRDGMLTSRNTFQKYFSQSELKDYLEHVLGRTVYMVAPGTAFVFASDEWEQRFSVGRYKTRGVSHRLLLSRAWRPREPKLPKIRQPREPKPSRAAMRFQAAKTFLDKLWSMTLEFGRWPEANEAQALGGLPDECPTIRAATTLIASHYELTLLASAASTRTDDLRVFFAAQQFQKRPAFKQLSVQLQRDVKAFFGDYRSAQAAGLRLLQQTSDTGAILDACREAFQQGLGWLDGEHSLQLHVDLVERLPALLRVYVSCGLMLWDSLSEIDLVKIHIQSGKLTLLQLDEFDRQPLPTLRRRVKVNLRKLDYDVFDYGSEAFPKPLLYRKSRFMHEDLSGFAEQQAFDEAMNASGLLPQSGQEPSSVDMARLMELARYETKGIRLIRSTSIPDLDQACGQHFRYRDLVECGETQTRLGVSNKPRRAQTYNALRDLAVHVLDPVIEYFGAIKLTYGFCSAALGRHITRRVAHRIDQHAAFELADNGKAICSRGGAACDFIIEYEDMEQVANWIIENVSFDRLYFYGPDRPLHVSYSDRSECKSYRMVTTLGGHLMPRNWTRR